MRRAIGWLVILVGIVAMLGGAFLAAAFGPDNTLVSGPHAFASDGIAVVTAPRAIAYAGPTVRIDVDVAEATDPVFVGVGRDLDVRDYFHGSAFTRIDELSVPWDTVTSEVEGDGDPAADPRDLDWWLVQDTGTGSASITLALPEQTVDVVVMDPDRNPGFAPEITVAVVQKGSFAFGLALAVAGLGIVLAGWVWGSAAYEVVADADAKADADADADSAPEVDSDTTVDAETKAE